MRKESVIEFFDRYAPSWDAGMIKSDEKIARILAAAGVTEGSRVLDVACGTGVIIPYYLALGASEIIGVDISPKMAEIAARKFSGQPRVKIVNADVETLEYSKEFTAVVVYNAFPHFPDPEALIAKLVSFLAPGGRLIIAHGMSRLQINGHHKQAASEVSLGLMTIRELSAIMKKYLTVTAKVSNKEVYYCCGELG